MGEEKEQMEQIVNLLNMMGEHLGEVSRKEGLGSILEKILPSEYANEQKEVNSIVEDWKQETFNALITGLVKPPVSYEDPDQSPLSSVSREGNVLRHKWASSMDYLPHVPMFSHFSDWLINIYLGNYSKFVIMIDKMSEEKIKKQLQMRETYLHVCAIFHVVMGARTLYPGSPMIQPTVVLHGKFESKHMAILTKLLELGADVNVHDVAGYTPLHHCLTSKGNDTTLEMAKLLLAKGANPNAVNRFGNSPIFECIMSDKKDAVKLLIKNGADPRLVDNDGVSPFQMGHKIPSMAKLLAKSDTRDIRQKQKQAEQATNLKKCSICKKPSTKRCGGCQQEYYCDAKCQKSHWKEHKSACHQRKSEYLPVEINERTSVGFLINYQSGGVKLPQCGEGKVKSHFVVKIQVPLDASDGKEMLIYDKDRSVFGFISSQTDSGAKLRKVILSKGYRGEKGYFNAVQENGRVSVSPEILVPQTW